MKHRVSTRLCVVALVFASALGGCSRAFWRRQADRDVYRLVEEKRNDPAWAVPRIDITPDPRSRFYDPYDLDKGPLPPDDTAAGEYMLQVAGKRGYKSWHKFGEAFSIENPHWLESFGLTPEVIQQASYNGEPSSVDELPGLQNLTMQRALELSYIHSRDYQTAIENVYLRALELSFERFQFDVRYLGIGGQRPTADLSHTSIPSTSDNLALDSRAGISQLLPSGGQWAVELANQTIWMFSGPNSMNTASTISYSLVQPLLFQAGRKIALENLTQAERNLLYSVRTLARFRKEFFTAVIGGSSGILPVLEQRQTVLNNQDNIRRNVEQLEVLTVLASQLSIEYYEELEALPQNIQLPPNTETDNLPPTVQGRLKYNPVEKRLYWRGRMAPPQLQTLLGLSPNPAWQRAVRSLSAQRIFESLDALPPGVTIPPELAPQLIYNAAEKRLYWIGVMSEAQERQLLALHPGDAWQRAVGGLINRLRAEILTRAILQLQSRLLSSQNQLRNAERNYQNALDRFKVQLGLPPNMPVTVDDSLLKQFQLIDPRVAATEQGLKRFVVEWAKLDRNDPDYVQLQKVILGLKDLRDRMRGDVIEVITRDLAEVKRRLPARQAELQTKEERAALRNDIDRSETLLRGTLAQFRQNSAELDRLVRTFASDQIMSNAALDAAAAGALGAMLGPVVVNDRKREARQRIAVLRENLLKLTQNAQVIQFGLRVELIPLERYPYTMEESVKRALASRLDLKNVKAQVMDARRAVEVAANRLEAVLNLRVEGNISTRGGNNKPLDFRGRNSNFRVGVGFTAPLDQVNARNAYRDAQIAYQRARRAYMALEDQIKLEVRANWRQLDVSRSNFERARQQVRVSALQYDSTIEGAAEPGQAGLNSNSGLDLLNALANVLDAQNGLIQIWVDYEQSRLNIYRDMGIMEIDAQGVWLDDYYQKRLPSMNVVPPQPAPTEGRLPNATHARAASKPELGGLERVEGSLRIRGDAGSLLERNRLTRNHDGDAKRGRIDPWAPRRSSAARQAGYQTPADVGGRTGNAGRRSAGLPVGSQ